MAMVCCLACRSQPTIFISASFVPSLLVGYRKVYSGRCEADVVMTSVMLASEDCSSLSLYTSPTEADCAMRLPLVILHISAGVLAMLAGALAISFRKGSRGHRVAGNVLVICMLSVSGLGAYVAFRKPEAPNVLGGILTFYLVATAWATATRGGLKAGNSSGLPPSCIGGGSNLVFLGSRGNARPNSRRGPKFRAGDTFSSVSWPCCARLGTCVCCCGGNFPARSV